ncbi:MAG: DUF3426 domain-containing protein, partial [Desulfosalsimonadaceae bacterium]
LDFETLQEPEADQAEEASPDQEESGDFEELDLTDMEEFLEETQGNGREDTEDTGEFSLDLEREPETGSAGPDEEEFDIDLSTLPDEGMEEDRAGEDFSMEREESKIYDLEVAEEEEMPGEPFSPGEAGFGMGATAEADEKEALEELSYQAGGQFPTKRRGRGKRIFAWLAALVVLLMIGGGAYLYFTGQEIPGFGQHSAEESGKMRIAVSSPDYRIVENEQEGRLLVVSGTVTNRYDHSRRHILVRANLIDGNGNRIGRAAAYSGNTFEDSQLKTLDMESINERLARMKGEGGANAGVRPGQSLPYMVVFSNLPPNMESLTVEVLSSKKAE